VRAQFLHSTGKHQFGQPIQGQREVSAIAGQKNQLNNWVAMEGYYAKYVSSADKQKQEQLQQQLQKELDGEDEDE
jgi:hypothetical protein